MPLQESFGKKKTKPEGKPSSANRMRVLSERPSLEDLRFILSEAQEKVRQPIVMMWKSPAKAAFLLTVTRNSEDQHDPTWMLHIDEGFDRTNIVWTYTTSDAELINSLLTEEVSIPAGPEPAVIPEALRPQAPREPGTAPEAHHLLGHVDSDGPVYFENYEILNTIGRGGMGIIYRAKSKADGSMVALKVLRTDLLIDPVSVRRFEHEATAASSLDHPNLIRVREFGLSRFGQPYLIMDFLDGVELQTLLSHCERLDLPMFVNIFTQICDALAYAHQKGLIHRDIKPGNIMLVKGPTGVDTVKIIDFGIAKFLCEQNQRNNITTTGEMLGSPAYMSPEQCGGVALDSRSDIYSLGCVMYEAIAGMLPFRNESAIGTIMMQVNDRPPPFASLGHPELHVPEELERMIFKAMEKDPANRYQCAGDLSEDLWAFAAMGYPAKRSDNGGTPAPVYEDVPTSIEEALPFHLMPQPQPVEPTPAPAPAPAPAVAPLPTLAHPPALGPAPATVSSSGQLPSLPMAAVQQPAQQPVPPPAPSWVNEHNKLSDRTYTLLRKTGVLSDSNLEIVSQVEKLIDAEIITIEQAVQVMLAAQKGIQLPDAVAMLTERKLTLFEALSRLEDE